MLHGESMSIPNNAPVEQALNMPKLDYLIHKYQGQAVTVFCSSGAVLKGFARFTSDGWVEIVYDKYAEESKSALCNLAYIISITVKA